MLVYKFLKEIIELKVSCLSSDSTTSLELNFRKVDTFWKKESFFIIHFVRAQTYKVKKTIRIFLSAAHSKGYFKVSKKTFEIW